MVRSPDGDLPAYEGGDKMTINAWDLLLNIFGALILLCVGAPPQEYTREELWKIPMSNVIATKYGRFKYWLSYAGLLSLLGGFALQLAGEFCR